MLAPIRVAHAHSSTEEAHPPAASRRYHRHLMKRLILAFILASVAVLLPRAGSPQNVPQKVSSPSGGISSQRGLVDKYCVTCHNKRTRQAGLELDAADVDHPSRDAELWEKVVRKLRTGAMPPVGLPRPDDSTLDGFVTGLEESLDRAATESPNPGRPAVHRLNRAEYTNAIRDLLNLEIDAATYLPADTTGFGFDNNADVLSVSPGLLERYMIAARRISRLAMGDPTIKPGLQTYSLPYMVLLQDGRMNDDMPFGSRGGTSIRHVFPVDGEYEIRLSMQRSYLDTEPRGLPTQELVDVRLDGARVALMPIGGPDAVGPNPYSAAPRPPADQNLKLRLPVTGGAHTITVSFQERNWYQEGAGPSRFPAASFGRQSAKKSSIGFGRVEMSLDTIFVEGPFNGTTPGDTASRRAIFVCSPTVTTRAGLPPAPQETACARRIVSHVARRAYRRTPSATDIDTLMGFFKTGHAQGGFDAGIQRALERVLVSPYFIYRVEADASAAKPGGLHRITDTELASRLSFFLWSSIPDAELLDLATAGRLHEPAVLERQVTRMLGDSRSDAMIDNFFGQWLYLRNMRLHRPDPKAFMDFDENLRQAFIKETQLFTASQVRENRSVTELLTANYTFVDERLARHYGISKIYGPRFRRVTFDDDRRGGILGQGSLLSVTSMSTRTSPVKRGAWLLEHLLGTPPPPPPPNVPALPESAEGQKVATSVRERMEQHRRNPTCAACHAKMDPLGFALENFDGVGQWRDGDGESKVDASGTLPDGTAFNGPAEFRRALLKRPEAFVGTVTRKLMTYALGRGVEYYDMPTVRRIVRDAKQDDYRWSALILGIVKSMPFQMRAAVPTATSAANAY